ncbi:unnamed protein product [Urochloa humidicola]
MQSGLEPPTNRPASNSRPQHAYHTALGVRVQHRTPRRHGVAVALATHDGVQVQVFNQSFFNISERTSSWDRSPAATTPGPSVMASGEALPAPTPSEQSNHRWMLLRGGREQDLVPDEDESTRRSSRRRGRSGEPVILAAKKNDAPPAGCEARSQIGNAERGAAGEAARIVENTNEIVGPRPKGRAPRRQQSPGLADCPTTRLLACPDPPDVISQKPRRLRFLRR